MVLFRMYSSTRRIEHDDQGVFRQRIRPGRRARPQRSKEAVISGQGNKPDGRWRGYDDCELAGAGDKVRDGRALLDDGRDQLGVSLAGEGSDDE